jgi:YHS domain-containing protein
MNLTGMGCDYCDKQIKKGYKNPKYIAVTLKGIDYDFCSVECLKKFLEEL